MITRLNEQPPELTTERPDIILRAEQITKLYPGTVALNKVDFNVYHSKVNVLIGENGAGKSTLMKILAGVEQATEGQVLLNGRPVQIRSPREAGKVGIGIIYQELNLFPNLSVSENIFMGHEVTTNINIIRHQEQDRLTAQVMARLEQPIDPRTPVGSLRIGQQQIVEIAKTLVKDVQILIMDEPTSALSNAEVEILFRVIQELKAQGVSIIYISHKLDELMQIGDYVTVLRDGRLAAESPIGSIDIPWIVEKMVGHSPTSQYKASNRTQGAEILRIENLSLPRPLGGYLLDSISFTLYAGEILGIYGLMGAGRTELFECLIGLHPGITGTIWVAGQKVDAQNVAQRINSGVVLIPEDRQREGLVQKLSVANNTILASLAHYVKRFAISDRKIDEHVNQQVRNLSIRVTNIHAPITSLSGGNQQKVVIAKALLTSPKVLLMDEPTRGIDVGAKQEIFQIMNALASKKLGIIFVSTELKEVMAMADRILVMSKGRITGVFDRANVTENVLVAASAVGHKQENRQEI